MKLLVFSSKDADEFRPFYGLINYMIFSFRSVQYLPSHPTTGRMNLLCCHTTERTPLITAK